MNGWPMQWLAVAAGGALGALIRYGLTQGLQHERTSYTWGTLAANLIGALLAGILVAWLETRNLSPQLRLFLQVGFLGALTTFSTFATEAMALLQGEKMRWFAFHLSIHVVGSLIMVFLGIWLVRRSGSG